MILDVRLEKINKEVLKLHEIAKESVELCLGGLRGDNEVRKRLEDLEREADILHSDVDYDCITVIALFQPVARDLRFVVSMMKISSGYERITDLALEIGYYHCEDEEVLKIFESMKDGIVKMFDVVERAYSDENVDLKVELRKLDNVIDENYIRVLGILKERCYVENALVARHLERMGDILGKIGSAIVFVREGRRIWIK